MSLGCCMENSMDRVRGRILVIGRNILDRLGIVGIG